MADFTWVFDAPTGVYKNHALSNSILEAAIEQTVVAPFAQTVSGYGKNKGESVTITRIANIAEPMSAVLSETTRIPEDQFQLSTKQITVQELGRAVPYTSLSQDLAHFDVENGIQRKLMQQMTLVLDTLAATGFKRTQIKYTPTGLSSRTVNTTGTPGTAAANLNMYHVEEIRDYMYDTLHVPPYQGSDYVGIFRTQGLRGLKRDPAWEEWHKYTDPQAKWNNEIGRIENVRFVETNHAEAFSNNLGTGGVLGEGVVFGDEGLYLAEVMTPELRAGLPEDFGRSKSVAWYGILEYDIAWDTGNPGEAKVLHVTSA